MEALRIVLNEANTDTIQKAEQIEEKIKNINRITTKLHYFVYEIMLAQYIELNGIVAIKWNPKEFEPKIHEMILEKNRKTKEKYSKYHISREKIAYVSGLQHAIGLIEVCMKHTIDKDCEEDNEIQNALNAIYRFDMLTEPNRNLLFEEIWKMIDSEKMIEKHIVTNEDAEIVFEELT